MITVHHIHKPLPVVPADVQAAIIQCGGPLGCRTEVAKSRMASHMPSPPATFAWSARPAGGRVGLEQFQQRGCGRGVGILGRVKPGGGEQPQVTQRRDLGTLALVMA